MKLSGICGSRELVTEGTYQSAKELVTSGAETAWEKIKTMINNLHIIAKDITGVDSKTLQEEARKRGIIK